MPHDENILLNVARSLRYRTLQPMLGKSVEVSARLRIVDDVSSFVSQFVDGCLFDGPGQNVLDGQIAKFGLLDLRFSAPSRMLDSVPAAGVPLLRELGFVDSDLQELAEELGDDANSCINELRDGIAENRTHLLLFLQASIPSASDMTLMDRVARFRNPSIIKFPITCSVVDACVSNSSFVWMNKHFYV